MNVTRFILCDPRYQLQMLLTKYFLTLIGQMSGTNNFLFNTEIFKNAQTTKYDESRA